jgi:hypothetical protein
VSAPLAGAGGASFSGEKLAWHLGVGGRAVRRMRELVKLRLMMGETATLRAAVRVARWRNMVRSMAGIVLAVLVVRVRFNLPKSRKDASRVYHT